MHYRLYTLDGRTGSITAGTDLSAADDAEAIALAEGARADDSVGIELWCGTRRVPLAGPARPDGPAAPRPRQQS